MTANTEAVKVIVVVAMPEIVAAAAAAEAVIVVRASFCGRMLLWVSYVHVFPIFCICRLLVQRS